MNGLSENSQKVLVVNLGEAAGREVAELFAKMAAEIEELRASKVTVTKIVPVTVDEPTTIAEPV